ncbi:glycosyltransferase family 8 C-terminal domain-containing protein, partial [Proteus mirabilis]
NNIDYLNYLLSSPWKDIPLVKPTNYKEIKKLSKVLLKKKEYIKFIYWYINYIVKKIKSDK